jgi:hypothetical protein
MKARPGPYPMTASLTRRALIIDYPFELREVRVVVNVCQTPPDSSHLTVLEKKFQ